MKKLLLSLSLLFVLASCSSDEPNGEKTEKESIKREDIALSRAEQDIISNQTDFAFKLLSVASQENDNIALAPQSLATLFAMMANGADGTTLAEMMALFGLQANELSTLNELNKTLAVKLPALDNNTTVSSHNSIWIDPSFTVYDSFKNTMQSIFSAELFSQSLYTQEGVHKLNSWCENKTDGMIKNFLKNPINAESAIINANYFNGNWANKFDESKTKNEQFTTASGTKQTVKMMNADELKLIYGRTDRLESVRIPYGNSAYSMTIILSKDTETLPQVTLADWKELNTMCGIVPCNLSIPRFSIEFKDDINAWLTQIGLSETLGIQADFSKFSPKHTYHSIQHAVKIDVNEQGTKAAAVSGDILAMLPGDYQPPTTINFKANKPFVFVISEKSTGTIMYIGTICSI